MRVALAALLLASVTACSGGNGDSSPSPSPSPNPSQPTQDPCASVRQEELEAPAVSSLTTKTRALDGSPRWRVLDALWAHQQERGRRAGLTDIEPRAATAVDVGEIAVIRDEGDLILPANTYDLKNVGLRFTRNGSGGYDVRQGEAAFRTTLGTRLTLTDDATVRMDVPFSFPFYAVSDRTAFVNSDGNITFGEGDARQHGAQRRAAADRSAARRAVPRRPRSDHRRTGLRQRRRRISTPSPGAASAASTRRSIDDGAGDAAARRRHRDEVRASIALGDAIVGVSPGRTGDFTPVESERAGADAAAAAAPSASGSPTAPQLDTVAVARKFYRTHPDNYDQLVIWTDSAGRPATRSRSSRPSRTRSAASASTSSTSRAISAAAAGCAASSMMDWLGKYPDDPTQRFLGENNTLSVLGQEVGHRWLAFLEFRDHTGTRSDALLGRDHAHWSFFFDSDASVMEGNDIEDLGGGSFRTIGAVQRYSRLDQYAMGLRPDRRGAAVLLRRRARSTSRSRTIANPRQQVGVTFNGTRRDVLIEDIVAIHGRASAVRAESPRVHRQAFVYVVGAGRTVEAGQVAKLDRIRRAWEAFFLRSHRRPDARGDAGWCQCISDAGRLSVARLLVVIPLVLGRDPLTRRCAQPAPATVAAGSCRRRSICRSSNAIEPLVHEAIAEKKLPGAVVLVGAAIASSIRRRSAIARSCRPGADDARHDVRPRVADQGRGDDDERDDARRAGQAAARTIASRPTSPASSATARPTSPSVI